MVKKTVLENIIKILKCLENSKNDWIWITELAKRSKLHRTTVSRLIDKYLLMFITQTTVEPFNIRMIRLKEGVDTKSIIKFIKLREKLKDL